MAESKKKLFIHCPELEQFPYPDSYPFKASRAGEVFKTLDSMGLLKGGDGIDAQVAFNPVHHCDDDGARLLRSLEKTLSACFFNGTVS